MAVELLGGLKVRGKIVALDGIETEDAKSYLKADDDVSLLSNNSTEKSKKLASEQYVDELLHGAIHYKGSCTNAVLQTMTSSANHGDMWNVTDDGTFPAGTNVVMIIDTSAGTRYWDAMSSPIIGDASLTVSLEGIDGTGTFTANQRLNGTIALTLPTTGVSPGTYGSPTQVPQITIDSKGRIVNAVNADIAMPTGFKASDGVALNIGEGTIDKSIPLSFKPCIVQFYDPDGNSTQFSYKVVATGIVISALGTPSTQQYTYRAIGWTLSQ